MRKEWRVSVVGATGLVGTALVGDLERRNFPVSALALLTSERGMGRQVEYRGRSRATRNLDDFDFRECDLSFFAAGAEVAARHVPRAIDAGGLVIDLSSQHRLEDGVPLVVADVNPHALGLARARRLVATPGSSTVTLALALKPLYDAVGIERLQVVTLESASTAGQDLVTQLASQSARLLNGLPVTEVESDAAQLAFNCVPGEEGASAALARELIKVFEDPSLRINATTVRVPTFFGESSVLQVETRRRLSVAEARELLSAGPGLSLAEEPAGRPLTAARDALEHDGVQIGWVREDRSHERGLALWVVSDNIRASAAGNAVQIAEILVRDYL